MREARIIELGQQDRRYKSGRRPSSTSYFGITLSVEEAERRVAELNEHYKRVGREWKVQTREIGEWEDH